MSDLTSLQLAKACAALADDKKAEDVVVLDLRKIEAPASFFVIASAQSEPQLKAIANHLEKSIKDDHGRYPVARDGFPTSKWVVVDYGDVIAHLFLQERRAYYGLEELWSDAPRVKI